MFDQSFSKSKDLGDMLRFLPGVVVQKHMSMQGMADLYRIKRVASEVVCEKDGTTIPRSLKYSYAVSNDFRVQILNKPFNLNPFLFRLFLVSGLMWSTSYHISNGRTSSSLLPMIKKRT